MKFIIYLSIACFSSLACSAQNYLGITPMHNFFKKNADSTYILQYTGNFIGMPEYYILSKTADTISTYTYKSNTIIDSRIKSVPKAIRDSFLRKNANLIYFVPVDINVFFKPKYLALDSLKQFWSRLLKLKLWQVNDDKIDGEGCEIKQNRNGSYNAVSDGGETHLYLITKENIKELYFYAPSYYNEKCPGRKGRKAIVEMEKVFTNYFKNQ